MDAEDESSFQGLRKGAWTEEEDDLLRECVNKYGQGEWHLVPLRAGLKRCRKSCRLRWLNYLHPNIRRGAFSEDEIDMIVRLHKLLGNRWTLIARRLSGRTANDVKNYWNTHMVRKTKTGNNIIIRPRPRPRTVSTGLTGLKQVEVAATDSLIQQANFDEGYQPLMSPENDPARWESMIVIEEGITTPECRGLDHERQPPKSSSRREDEKDDHLSLDIDLWDILSFDQE